MRTHPDTLKARRVQGTVATLSRKKAWFETGFKTPKPDSRGVYHDPETGKFMTKPKGILR